MNEEFVEIDEKKVYEECYLQRVINPKYKISVKLHLVAAFLDCDSHINTYKI